MIFDTTANLYKYQTIPYLLEICDFLNNNNVLNLPSGDISILDEKLFVKVLRYIPKNSSELFFETHLYYADVQIVFDGIETMQVADLNDLEVTDEFKLEGDFVFYKGAEKISQFVVSNDKFTVFFPGEAHKPGCSYDAVCTSPVLKLVFKVLMPLP